MWAEREKRIMCNRNQMQKVVKNGVSSVLDDHKNATENYVYLIKKSEWFETTK